MRFTVAASFLLATLAVASPVSVDEAKADALKIPGVADTGSAAALANPDTDSAALLGSPGLAATEAATSAADSGSPLVNRAPGDVQCNRTCPRARQFYLDNCEEAAKKLGNRRFEVASPNLPEYVEHGNCRIRITGPENTVCQNTGGNIRSHFRAIRDLGCRCGHFKWRKNDQCATVVEKTDY